MKTMTMMAAFMFLQHYLVLVPQAIVLRNPRLQKSASRALLRHQKRVKARRRILTNSL